MQWPLGAIWILYFNIGAIATVLVLLLGFAGFIRSDGLALFRMFPIHAKACFVSAYTTSLGFLIVECIWPDSISFGWSLIVLCFVGATAICGAFALRSIFKLLDI